MPTGEDNQQHRPRATVLLFTFLCVLCWVAARTSAAVVEEDAVGNLHITTATEGAKGNSSSGQGRVFVNGMDVVEELKRVQLQQRQLRCKVEGSVDTTSISGVSKGSSWRDGVLAPNGKIYAVPQAADHVLIIDPATSAVDRTSIAGLGHGGTKWASGAVAPNGKIYCVPQDSSSVLIIDPDTDTADTTSIAGLGEGGDKWENAVLAPNGKIYAVPDRAPSVLIIDPTTNAADTTTIPLGADDNKFLGAVFVPATKKIYAIPSSATFVLIIDPEADTADETSISGLPSTGSKWLDGVLADNGKVYGIPHNADAVLIIDPETNTADITTMNGLGEGGIKWWGGALATNGKIYAVPYAASSVLTIDPLAEVANATAMVHGDNRFLGAVSAPPPRWQSIWHSCQSWLCPHHRPCLRRLNHMTRLSPLSCFLPSLSPSLASPLPTVMAPFQHAFWFVLPLLFPSSSALLASITTTFH